MRRKLVVGNWKMNGSLTANASLLSGLVSGITGSAELVVCVPFPYLAQCQVALSGSTIAWGAQDVSEHFSGAYTGEVAASMLHDFGCRYVILGHSERRTFHVETDEQVARKVQCASQAGLLPIVCVGETLLEREAGATEAVVVRQVETVLNVLGQDELANIVLAYEPVWAIGTGRTATPAMAQEVHALLRDRVSLRDKGVAEQIRIVYGGSMKPENAKELMAMPDIDGGLIGGASLKTTDFLAIAQAA